jgi:hypothetical protein
MMFEWTIHNAGYYVFGAGEAVCDMAGIDYPDMGDWKDSCSEVDLGPTIYHDSGDGTRGAMGTAMKITYTITCPVFALLDKIAYFVY